MSLGPATTIARLREQVGDLVSAHRSARDLRAFRRYADDPIGFVRRVLKGEPWARQEAIAALVRDHPLVAVRSCNSAGKDWIAAALSLWWVYARQGLVLLTGPTQRQVVEILMQGEVRRAFARAEDLPGELYQSALRVPGAAHAGILAFTSSEASRMTGHHAPRVLAILTEAQACEDFAYEGLLACATGDGDRVLAVGNPLAPTGRFYAVQRPGTGWVSLRIAADEHPNVVHDDPDRIPGGVTRAFVGPRTRSTTSGSSSTGGRRAPSPPTRWRATWRSGSGTG